MNQPPDLTTPMQADEARAMATKLEPLLAQVEAILREHGAVYLRLSVTQCPDHPRRSRSVGVQVKRLPGEMFWPSRAGHLIALVDGIDIMVAP